MSRYEKIARFKFAIGTFRRTAATTAAATATAGIGAGWCCVANVWLLVLGDLCFQMVDLVDLIVNLRVRHSFKIKILPFSYW